MRRSLRLRAEPTARQTRVILERVERELSARGTTVERERSGALRFRMPPPWRALHLGLLLAVTSGRVIVTASGGGPWRVSYDLNFRWLRVLTLAASAVLVAIGWGWPRLTLLNALALLWTLFFGVLYVAGLVTFQRLVATAAHEVIERRRASRAAPGTTAPGTTAPGSDAPGGTASGGTGGTSDSTA